MLHAGAHVRDTSFGMATGTPTLPRDPGSAPRAGAFRRIPVLSGNSRDEARLTTMFVEALTGPVTRERYEKLLRDSFGADAAAIERRYPADDSAAVRLDAALRWLGDAMIDAWTRFAHTGRPGWPKTPYVWSFGQRIESIDAARVHKCDLWGHTPSAVVR